MSQERKNEIQRQGFIDGLMGIEDNQMFHVLNTTNPYRMAYYEGRRQGSYAKTTPQGLRLRNKLDKLIGLEIYSTEHDYKEIS